MRYVLVGAVMDFTIYIALSLAPLLAERHGAGPRELGILPASWAVAYSLTAVFGGRLSDRISRTALARAGVLLVVVACLWFARADRIWHFWAGMPFIALGMASFWPALQAAIADESTPATLWGNLGWFNIAWSAGKGLGILAGGILLEALDRNGFFVAAAVGVLLMFVMPRVARGGGRGAPLVEECGLPPARVRDAFRRAALLANFAAFGLGTTIVNHYPEWNAALGRGSISYGVVVGGVFLAQTAGFGLLVARPGWKYRAVPLLGLPLLSGIGVFALSTRLPVPVLLPLMIAVGGGLAISYFASIAYSLHADEDRGGRAGLHEAILGTGNFLVPFLAGLVTPLLGFPQVPYWFAGVVVMGCFAGQVVVLARAGVTWFGPQPCG